MPGDWSCPRWIAHRGAGRVAPENTLAAFRVGASHGYRAFECDVKLSADGVPFLLHDATLDRTTSGTGPASALDWRALARLDAGAWHSPRFAGEPVPSLDAVAGFCIDHGHALNIELKPSPGADEPTGRVVAERAARLWREAGALPLLSSFRPAALAAARHAEPALPRALLLDTLRPGWLDEAASLGCVAVVAAYQLLDSVCLDAIHGAGLRALAYTVNDAATVERLVRLGIDGLITDAVDRFAPGAETLPLPRR